MKVIGNEIIEKVNVQAKESPRLRMNYNIHECMEETVHKMINSLQLGTVLPIHRHLHPAKKETFVLLRGELEVLHYNDEKEVIERHLLSENNGNCICEIMPEEWHSLNVLSENTVILEIKQGPYIPFQEIDLLK